MSTQSCPLPVSAPTTAEWYAAHYSKPDTSTQETSTGLETDGICFLNTPASTLSGSASTWSAHMAKLISDPAADAVFDTLDGFNIDRDLYTEYVHECVAPQMLNDTRTDPAVRQYNSNLLRVQGFACQFTCPDNATDKDPVKLMSDAPEWGIFAGLRSAKSISWLPFDMPDDAMTLPNRYNFDTLLVITFHSVNRFLKKIAH